MALHQSIQRLLLLGVRLPHREAAPKPRAPAALLSLIAAVKAEHARFDARAIEFGHRYRSGFWAIYLLSAIAVLFAILPLALGWDSSTHRLHPFAGIWALGEVLVIGTVSLIYWRGHRRDWQGQWLRARTTAELVWYLPMLAPLLESRQDNADPNWYLRAFDAGHDVRSADEVASICARCEALLHELPASMAADPEFATHYSQWAIGVLEEQRHYHEGVAHRQHALLHRIHTITGWLFALTAIGALLHLVVHTLWLSLVTTFFPALGASLHGALAQSEAYRLGSASERLVVELQDCILRIRAAGGTQPAENWTALQESVKASIALILEEHQDWNLLIRPHHLPLG